MIFQVSKHIGNQAWVKAMVLAGIGIYQRYLSPHKGFSCAHRRLYGGVSCSEYFRQAVRRYGAVGALPRLQQRFMDCGEANRILRSQCTYLAQGLVASHEPIPDDKKRQKNRKTNSTRRQTNNEVASNGISESEFWDCCCSSLQLGPDACDVSDCGLDNALDCSDCSGCDVSDCGGCGS